MLSGPSSRRAAPYALAAVLCWSTAATAFKLTLRHAPVLTVLFIASLTSLAIFTGALAVGGRLVSAFLMSRREWAWSALMGFLSPFLYYVVLFTAYDRLPAQQALVLNYTWPVVLTVFAAILLHRPLRIRGMISLIAGFAGVVLVVTGGRLSGLRFSDPAGVSLAVGSAAVWALYWIGGLRDPRSGVEKLWAYFLFGTVYVAVLACVTGAPLFATFTGTAGGVYIGVFEMGVTFLLWTTALTLTEHTARIANLVFLSPFLSLVWIFIVLGESVSPATVAGLALIVCGIVVQGRVE